MNNLSIEALDELIFGSKSGVTATADTQNALLETGIDLAELEDILNAVHDNNFAHDTDDEEESFGDH